MTADQSVAERPLSPRVPEEPSNSAALRSSVTELEQNARAFIKQRPVVAVLAALGAGYLIARLVSRGRR